MGQVNGSGRLSTPNFRDPSTDFHETWKILLLPKRNPACKKIRWLRRRGWSEKCHFHAWMFLSILLLRRTERTCSTSLYIVQSTIVPFGSEIMKFEIWPLYPSKKNLKRDTLSWQSMKNCNSPKSGTVSHIQFKLGTRIDTAWHHVTWL